MGTKFVIIGVLLCSVVLAVMPCNAQRIRYVKTALTDDPNDDGLSWQSAYGSLRDAIDDAGPGDEIWVAEGRYPPRGRRASFELKPGVALYGGFAGTETRRDKRDSEAHPTILSGDLWGNDSDNVAPNEASRRDNSFHVLVARRSDANTILDGFIVSGGHAEAWPISAEPMRARGGGLIVYPGAQVRIRNVVFRDNAAYSGGGAIASYGVVRVVASRFESNLSAGYDGLGGGGVYLANEDGATTEHASRFEDVVFAGNRARFGGGLLTEDVQFELVNSTFRENHATRLGGGAYVSASQAGADAHVISTTFEANSSDESGGGMVVNDGLLLMANAVFSDNAVSADGVDGGAILLSGEAEVDLINSTIRANRAPLGGALGIHSDARLRVANSIIWGNTSDDDDGISIAGDPNVTVSHTILEGGVRIGMADGGGNLAVNPMFREGHADSNAYDVRLRPSSPAIDAGDNEALPSDRLDLDGDDDFDEPLPLDRSGMVRVLHGGVNRVVVDLGAFEHVHLPQEPGAATSLLRVYPNPVIGRATIEIIAADSKPMTVAIYDALGRRRTILERFQVPRGTRAKLELDASRLPSGLYYVRSTGGNNSIKPFVVIR